MNLSEEEVARLVDLLRRNLLYQTPEISNDCAFGRVRVRFEDLEVLLTLIDKAGGWDLSDEERARVLARDCERVAKAIESGALVDLTGATVGEVMMLLEAAEKRGDTNVAHACVAELASRSN